MSDHTSELPLPPTEVEANLDAAPQEVVIQQGAAASSSSSARKRRRDDEGEGDMGEKHGRSYEVLVAINRRAKSIFEAFDKLIRKAESFQSLRTSERKDRFNNMTDVNHVDDAPVDLDSQIEVAKSHLVELLKKKSRRDKSNTIQSKPSLESYIYVPGGDILHYEGIQWRVNAPDSLVQEIFLAKQGYDLEDLQNKPELKRRWKTFERNTDGDALDSTNQGGGGQRGGGGGGSPIEQQQVSAPYHSSESAFHA